MEATLKRLSNGWNFFYPDRRTSLSPATVLSILLLGLAHPSSSHAQTIQGQLLETGTGTAMEGALVLLLDESGREHSGYLTNSAGRFLVRAPGPGRYVLKVVRIGYETVVSDTIDLGPDPISGLQLETAVAPIALSEIEAKGRQQCRVRPEEGLEVARVWEEVRKALTVQEWTEREGLYLFNVSVYERDLDSRARRVLSEEQGEAQILNRAPFRSLPAEVLMKEGFIRELSRGPADERPPWESLGGTYEYFGPDASVFLANVFLDSHCFKLAEDKDSPGLLGLAFEPSKKRETTDIEGTLWVDRETTELRYLEFEYTSVPFGKGRNHAGGQVDFGHLSSGAWVVRKWWIRMPVLEMAGRAGIRVTGFREIGAIILSVTPVGG